MRRRLTGQAGDPRHRRHALSARVRPHSPGAPPPVRILLNAYAMGGTIRTTLALAGHLAQTREVEAIARGGPAAARSSVSPRSRWPLDDRGRAQAPAVKARADGTAERAHASRDFCRYQSSSLWTDMQLLRQLRVPVARSSSAAREGLARAASAPEPSASIREHMNLRAHRPALARLPPLPRPRRARGAHRGQRADYEGALRCCVADPNSDAAAQPAAARAHAPGSCAAEAHRQKGFDLPIAAFARLARRHPAGRCGSAAGPSAPRCRPRSTRRVGPDRADGADRQLGEALAEAFLFVLARASRLRPRDPRRR